MKIVICNSQEWFNLKDDIASNHTVLRINKRRELTLSKLAAFKPDLVFFPHWSWLVKKEIYSKFRCIVFHTAPLPYGRGGSPIQNLIKRGHTSSPVCAIAMCGEVDSGPIYDSLRISLSGSLHEILKRLDEAVNQLIEQLIKCLPEPVEQVGNVEIFERLAQADNELCFDSDYEEFYTKIRMLDAPSYPSAHLKLENVLIEFSEIQKDKGKLVCQVQISRLRPSK